jgi:hypothetical protein
MRWLYFAAGLLWVVLVALLFGMVAALGDTSMTLGERSVGILVMAALAAPVAWQLRATHRQIRDMTASRIVLNSVGIEIQLSGRAREWKGLPDVPQTLVPWSELLSIVRERRRFTYPSVVPLGYPLDVYTLYSRVGGISFTRECIPNAGRVARQIADKVGSEL